MAIAIAIGLYVLNLLASGEDNRAIIAGFTIGYGNALLGFAALSWGIDRSNQAFMVSFLGGMIFRFLLIFALLFLLIRALKYDQVAILVPLLATYFLFLGLEIFLVAQFSDSERTQ